MDMRRTAVFTAAILLMSLHSITNGTTYSEWIPVPAEKSTFIHEIKDSIKFQIRTDKKIDDENFIQWSMGQVGLFELKREGMNAIGCGGSGKLFSSEKSYGFLERAGDITFLKTVTQLQVWFDDTLEATWTYEDTDDSKLCSMRNILAGMRFKSTLEDKVSSHYRYEMAGPRCSGLDPAWVNLITATTFPVETGTEIALSCAGWFHLTGSLTITCQHGITFIPTATPFCVEGPGSWW
ncbi:hypothetical protein ACHWQZ_G019306 [Mnemiopsis leidyi]